MAEFEIDLKKAAGWADRIHTYCNELKLQKSRVENIAGQSGFRQNAPAVEQALSMIAANLGMQQVQMKQYGDLLGTITKTYKGAESAAAAAVSERRRKSI